MFYPKNKAEELSAELFQNPTSEYRGTPFWAWNCKMDSALLHEQIDCLKEMGFGGFHMHSRSGMAMPYLQKDFMDLVKSCTQKAKDKGMFSYLYDEDRWPSGSAGGLVTRDHKYRQKYLIFTKEKQEHLPLEESMEQSKFYLLGTYDILLNENGELSDYRRIGEDAPARGNKWYAYMRTSGNQAWFNNQAYIDTMDKEAMDQFIRITYEAYYKAVGEEFGKTVPSIFTDEPQFAFKQALGFADSDQTIIFPWTLTLPQTFCKAYGYDLMERLPELFWNLPDNAPSTARYHYHNHLCDRFTQSFADNCGDWCEAHGLALTGHMMCEQSLFWQTGAIGEAMRSYRAFHIPGIDMLCNCIELSTAKQCQSAVHQYGREAMLSELYGVTNWDFDFRDHKFQGDWQAALGVTVRVPHLSWVSMAGEAKRDYPASINYQAPWYREYSYIEDHFARVNTAMTRGVPQVKVGVIHPIESYWLQFGPKENTLDIRNQMQEKFENVLHWLLFGTIDFDYISESLLPDQFRESDHGLQVGVMNYEVVIVPDCLTLRQSTLEVLEKFRAKGGKVIFMGNCPLYIDAVPSSAAETLYRESIRIPFDRISLMQALKEQRQITIKTDQGFPTVHLIHQLRKDGQNLWLFIAAAKKPDTLVPLQSRSQSPLRIKETTAPEDIFIELKGLFVPTLYNTLDGTIADLPYHHKAGKTIIPYSLYQSDSILLKLTPCQEAISATNRPLPEKKLLQTIRLMSKVPYERTEDNVLLLDRAEYALNEEYYHQEEEILILDNLCRKKMGWQLRQDAFPQPWVIEDLPVTDYLRLRFTFHSEIEVSGCKLAVEDAEQLEISLNGEEVPNTVIGYYVDHSIKTVALPTLHAGENILTLKIPFGRRTNTEWCYILGDFNVRTEGLLSTIVAPTNTMGFSDITRQGLPFYGGNLIYKAEVETPDCMAKIHASHYRGALQKLRIDGKDLRQLTFAPYTAEVALSQGKHTLEFIVYGNRVNTFGGLHNVSQPLWVGPDFWRSTGDQWCYEYQLKETGLLSGPFLELYEK